MSHDEHPDIQNFLAWVQKNSVYAVQDPDKDERRAFVPLTVVKEYFGHDSNARLKGLLAAVFYPNDPPVDPEDIFENCIQIFCILVEIGKGKFINFFSSSGYGDVKLYYDPDHTPSDLQFPNASDPGFYKNFCDKQWKFCAPELKSPMTNIRFHSNQILPIVNKERISSGGSAALYKIRIHSSYNKLGSQNASTSQAPTNTYALKSYSTPDAKRYYDNEVAAFRKLRSIPNSGFIGFYGCYTQAQTFNVILEFADKGTLEEYFQKNEPPVRGDDILNFWSGMFQTIRALKCIHIVDPGKGAKEGSQILHGFHQDIKPANILVKSNGVASPYKWEFKVADLGLSHFKKVGDEREVVTADDSHGTRTYGAPECYRGDEFLEHTNLEIKPNVDVWSLGGVFSEAAIWVAQGYKGLSDYRIGRKEETDRLIGFKDGNCFHDGEKVLRAVAKWHQDILAILRKSDNITTLVLSLIQDDMLVYWDGRSTAIQLWRKSDNILKKAREIILPPDASTKDPFSSEETSPLQPPERPPSHHPPPRPTGNRQTTTKQTQAQVSFSSSSNQYGARRDPSPDRVTMSEGEGSGRRDRTDTYDSYPGRRFHRTDSELPREDRSRLSGIHGKLPDCPRQSSDQHSRSGYPERRQSRTSIPGSENGADYGRRSSDVSESYREEKPYNEDNGEGSSIGRSRSKRSPSERPDTGRGLTKVHEDSGDSFDNVNGKSAVPRGSPSPEQARRPDVFHHHHHHQQKPPQPTDRPRIPFLSVSEAKDWKMKEKQHTGYGFRSLKNLLNPSPNTLPDDYLLKELEERDHMFLIDDAASMEKYWEELITLIDVLSYIVKSADPDGLEMYYTISPKLVRSKDSSDLVKSLRKTIPQGVSNLGTVLGGILGPYNVKLEKTLGSTVVTTQNAIRPLSLYVLTDGNWQPESDAETPIREVVRNLLGQRKLNKHQVGIQFIRFGNNFVCGKMLRQLDDNLTMEKAGVKIDIVDTEPSNGNVWKMLLGAINPWFDRGDSPS